MSKLKKGLYSTLKKGYYQADTINGVHFAGELLESDADLISARDFADSLRSLSDDAVIFAFFDESTAEILAEIDEEFGVH